MIRFQLQFVAVTTILLAGVMLMIRAQPYDEHDAQALLLPDTCAAPCFMGIQPGITTLEQAIAILKNSAWVEQVNDDPSTAGSSAVTWTWSSNKPALIRDGSSGLLVSHTDAVLGNVIDRVRIITTLPTAYVALLLAGGVTPITSGRNYANNQAYIEMTDYQDSIRIWSIMDCPITKRKFLETPASIDFNRQSAFAKPAKAENADFYWCWRHTW